jgi:hypothetical protein
MIKYIVLIVVFFVSLPLVYAQNLEMSVNQSTYYFKIGEDAIVPLQTNNSYGKEIDGMLQYTITQQINQGNTQFSSSNTQVTALNVRDGNKTNSLNFGTSNSPTTFTVNLSFNYNDGNNMVVNLDPITIIFVSDESQKNNVQNKIQGSSEKMSPQSQNDPFLQQQQTLQQRMEQMMQNQLAPQDPQQRLQNNQIPQDSSTLKQQIQKQLEEKNQLQKEFENQLALNEKFQKMHQGLMQQGYNVTDGNINPISNSTGDFEVNYKNKEGNWAKIQGTMKNGTVTDIEKHTQKEIDDLISKLRQDSTFKKYVGELNQEGFSEKSIEFQQNKNTTNIQLTYQNQKEQSAYIKAEFENKDIVKIDLEKPNQDYSYLWPIPVIALAILLGFFAYKKIKMKKKSVVISVPKTIHEKPFDYVFASNRLIQKAKEDFKEQRQKEAYGGISQAIRLFLSYRAELKREITNEDILLHLTSDKYPIEDIKNCFKLSSLVEFAKYTPNKIDFDEMCLLAEKIINGHYDNNKLS